MVVVFYILKLRRRPVAVPFSKIWDRILRDKEATSLFSQLKRLLSLLLQLALLTLPLLALAHYVSALDLNPLSFAWLLALATADGHISVGTAFAVSLWLACLAGLLVVLRVRRKVEAEAEPERPRTRGPKGYAGPGSLGGTESALRR